MTAQLDNYYTIFDIQMDADADTIEAAIKGARKRWRQMQGSPDKDRARLAEQRMEQLQEANEILLDAGRRAQYDATLKMQLSAPAAVPAAAPGAGTDWGQRAKEYYESGDTRNAFTAAKKGTDVDSQNNESWLYYVLSAIDLKHLQDADFASAELVNRVPGQHTSHDLRGTVLDHMKRYSESEISFRTAAQLEPGSAYYHGRAAWAVLDQGRIDDAVAEAKNIAAQFPGQDYPYRVLRAATDALRSADRPVEALALSRELLNTHALQNDEDLILTAILSIQDIEKQGDIGTVCTEAWSLLDQFPNNPKVQKVGRFAVGAVLERNLYTDAVQWSKSLYQRLPNDPLVKSQLARCLLAEAESQMSETNPGSYTIVNKPQVEYMAKVLQEIDALQVTEQATIADVNRAREYLAKQAKTTTKLSGGKIILGIAAFVLIMIGLFNLPGGFFTLLIGGLLVWLFWTISFPKQYKLNYKAQTPQVRSRGLQK